MTSNVVRFDAYHPEFADTEAPEMTLQIEVRAGGHYLGFVRIIPRIEAFDREWLSLGGFATSDEAIDAVMTAAADQQAAVA